jgi:O-acetylhomoserine (thiol)-lyase
VTTPYLCKPFDLGADLVMHSATKFLAGHGTVIGGLLVDSGKFDWKKSGKFPSLSEPYVGFHGLNFAEEFGPAAFILRARREGLRDFGACLSPHSAFLILQGMETLSLRMRRHIDNTHAVIDYLSESPFVEKIFHPYLPDHPQHDLAATLFPDGAGAVLSFNIKGGRDAGRKVIGDMRLFSHLANIGDAKSLVLHPASTTHSRMSEEDLIKAGISPGLIRLSIGLEDIDDIKADLDTGFRAVKRLLK